MSETDNASANALCVFSVVVDGNGVPHVVGQGIEGVRPYREPTFLDIRRALMELAADYQARAIGDGVLARFIEEGIIRSVEPTVADRVSDALAARE